MPLCVQEVTTPQVRSYLRKFAPVVWWASAVEVHSAVARLYRSGALGDAEKQGALTRLAMLRRGWREILPGDSLLELADQLLDSYTLRAADSLQLAAALTWCQHRPAQRHFISADRQLCAAAEAAGFLVLPLRRSNP